MKRFRCVIFLFVMFFLGLMAVSGASATTYQEEVNIRFTFDQTLSVDLSSTSLAISNLAPGTTGTSSPIDVTVNTNNIGGYTLTASVGDASHNTTSLTRADGVSAAFTNIARDANLTALSTDNTWGYSVDAGAHFFGLPLYSDAESLILKETDGAVEDNTVSFLIGAKAGVSQPLGDYSNVVNFKAVAKVYEPPRTFQEIEYSEYATLLPQVGDTMRIRDSRDGEIYTIGRLADGNVWLLDNLRLDLSTTRNLTTANTNITSSWTAPTEIATWSNVYNAPKIATSGTGDNGDWTKDTLTSHGSGSGKIGVYYNYCAATAGTYCYASNAGTGNATSDICPKGWRMPTGGSSGEYQALYTAYSSNATNFKNALRTPLSGRFYNGSAGGQGSGGLFWSSTYYDSGYMYSLGAYSSNVYPQDSYGRGYGLSVRCVLDVPVSTPTLLQTATDAQLASVLPNVGDVIELMDGRDCRTYHIGKLADGNIWFLDDMRITSETECESAPDWEEYSGSGFFSGMEDEGWYLPYSYDGYTLPYYMPNSDDPIYIGGSVVPTSYHGHKYNFCAASNGSWCPPDQYSGGDPGAGGECWEEDPSMCDPGGSMYDEDYMRQEYMNQILDMYGYTIQSSICPEGWSIPSSETLNGLRNSYGSSYGFENALRISFGDGGAAYWTNSVSDVDVYFPAVVIDNADTFGTLDRSNYAFVRCVRGNQY